MKRFLSFVLSLVMIITTFVHALPPLKVSAATAASVSSLKASPDEPYKGDSVQVKGTVKSGSFYLRAIQINVRNEGDDNHGFTVDRVEFDFSDKKTSYSLSNLDEIDIGSYTCTNCGRKESLNTGEHRIDIHIGLYDSNGDVAEGLTKRLWIEVLEEEAPYVKSIDTDVAGTEVDFTVKTNSDAKYGIVLYADGYKLDMIDWDKSEKSSYIQYTGSHSFNQTGSRKITVYALDADGNEVADSKATTTITISSLGKCSTPKITTKTGQEIELGEEFKITWDKSAAPKSGVEYNVYVNNRCVNASPVTGTSYTLKNTELSKTGTYSIYVIAMADDYEQSEASNVIKVTVTEPVVVESPEITSVKAEVETMNVDFTVKTNSDAKYGIVLYADGYKLDMIDWDKSEKSSYIQYTGSHSFNQTGSRKITVYALDADGNEVADSKATAIVTISSLGKCSAPKITTKTGQEIELGEEFKITWDKSAQPKSGVTYNVYVNNRCVNASQVTGTSYTLKNTELSQTGTYAIYVMATAEGYEQSDISNVIKVTVTEPVVVEETESETEETTEQVESEKEETEAPVTPIILATPQLSGSNKISYGDSYTISWDYDSNVDYYLIAIDGLSYKKTVDATEKSFTIPAKVFMQYNTTDVNYTISLVAMSNDSKSYLPSEAAAIRVTVAAYSASQALIKSVEILNGNHITAGEVAKFKVITTSDVTAIRMKDGAGSFIVNTWYADDIGSNSANEQYYEDDGSERIWYVQQKINHAGNTGSGVKRSLTFYSMVNETEYNRCSTSFYCEKGNDVIGSFSITAPSNGSLVMPSKDLVIKWTSPENTTVDRYIIAIYHGETVVDRAEVKGNEYTLSGSYLVRDNTAWKIHITARKEEGQWAESVAAASFKLECTHERTGKPTETAVSWTDKNATEHICSVVLTYPCLDCGLTNAKKVPDTIVREHTWLDLDKGGKVCNQCWRMESDGSYPAKKNAKLSDKAKDREDVYWSVDANGNPVNRQAGRYVEKTDPITILGVVGNCYLIEYPITVKTARNGSSGSGITMLAAGSGGYNRGTIKQDLVDEGTENSENTEESARSYSQIIVDNFINSFYNPNTPWHMQKFRYEFSTAEAIVDDVCNSMGWYIATVVSQGYMGNISATVSNVMANFGGDDNYSDKLFKTFLNNVITEIPTVNSESTVNINKISSGTSESIEVLNHLSEVAEQISDEESLLAEAASADIILNSYIQKIGSNVWFKDRDFSQPKIIKLINEKAEIINEYVPLDKYVDIADFLTGYLSDYILYTKIQVAGCIEYYVILMEMFPEEAELIKKECDRYLEENFSLVAYVIDFLQNTTNSVIAETLLGGILKVSVAGFNALAKKMGWDITLTKIFAKLSITDSVIQLISNLVGITEYAQGSQTLVLFYYINDVIRYELLSCVNDYRKGDDSTEKAQRIIDLYNMSRGCQIYINNNALSVTNDLTKKTILSDEIEHIQNTDIEKWKLNPYYGQKNIQYPNVNKFDNIKNGYYYKILLEGYINKEKDGLLGEWDKLADSEKQMITSEIDALYDFGKHTVESCMLLESGYTLWNGNQKTHIFINQGLSILFINNMGNGLIIRYFDNIHDSNNNGFAAGQNFTSFKVISKNEVNNIIAGKSRLPEYYFAVTRHQRLGYNYNEYGIQRNVFDDTTDGWQSIIYVNSDNFTSYCMSSYKRYIKVNISQQQYSDILDFILSYKYYEKIPRTTNLFDKLIDNIWNVWIWSDTDLAYIAEKFNKKAQKSGDYRLKVSVVESNWAK